MWTTIKFVRCALSVVSNLWGGDNIRVQILNASYRIPRPERAFLLAFVDCTIANHKPLTVWIPPMDYDFSSNRDL